MRRLPKTLFLAAVLISALRFVARIADYVQGARLDRTIRGPLTTPEVVELGALCLGILLLAGLAFCAVSLKACHTTLLLVLTGSWIALFTWWYWFSFGAPGRLYQLHTLDPAGMRSERQQHLLWSLAAFSSWVACYLIFPLSKMTQRRS